MATELRPGVFSAIFRGLDRQAQLKAPLALTRVALIVEARAKQNASMGAHAYGTPTPARPGAGPAVISGTLRRALTHTAPALSGGRWQAKVGTATGFYPSYGGSRRTPANKYGYYLEHGLRNGAKYPFLLPAFAYGVGAPARAVYDQVFGERCWARVL